MSPAERSIEAQISFEVEPITNVTVLERELTITYEHDKSLSVNVNIPDDTIYKIYIDLDNTKHQ